MHSVDFYYERFRLDSRAPDSGNACTLVFLQEGWMLIHLLSERANSNWILLSETIINVVCLIYDFLQCNNSAFC